MELDSFTRAYIQCALWTTDEHPPSGEWQEYYPYCLRNIDADTLRQMTEDCEHFQTANEADIRNDLEQAGHDFWLTRNGHGCGFWDGDYPEELGRRLTTAAIWYGSYSLYLGDDGKLYGTKG